MSKGLKFLLLVSDFVLGILYFIAPKKKYLLNPSSTNYKINTDVKGNRLYFENIIFLNFPNIKTIKNNKTYFFNLKSFCLNNKFKRYI